jgi:U4/U6.U5 tri-snRNP-associated protein 3
VAKQQDQEDRRARMARLRAEMEQEEQEKTAVLEQEEAAAAGKPLGPQDTIVEVNQEELEGLDEEEQMQKLLGFTGSFGTTKGSKVDDNHESSARGAAAKNKSRKYRQYMNRKNGFNRPLEKMN